MKARESDPALMRYIERLLDAIADLKGGIRLESLASAIAQHQPSDGVAKPGSDCYGLLTGFFMYSSIRCRCVCTHQRPKSFL